MSVGNSVVESDPTGKRNTIRLEKIIIRVQFRSDTENLNPIRQQQCDGHIAGARYDDSYGKPGYFTSFADRLPTSARNDCRDGYTDILRDKLVTM